MYIGLAEDVKLSNSHIVSDDIVDDVRNIGWLSPFKGNYCISRQFRRVVFDTVGSEVILNLPEYHARE